MRFSQPTELSMDSPVAKALLGKEEGDEVTIRRPRGGLEITIVKVSVNP